MQTLFLGYSSICRRRILPALAWAGMPPPEVASVSHPKEELLTSGIACSYGSYERALQESRAEIVYVSTINSLHKRLAEAALRRGFHVIVDKPAFLSESETEAMVRLAEREGRCLAEAMVFGLHPRVQAARAAFKNVGAPATHVVASFSMPPLAAKDFRYVKAMGGGAIFDLGPYALASGRLFFNAEPVEIVARRTAERGDIETGFSLLALYSGGRSLVGIFGYETAYLNHLQVTGPDLSVSMDRVFSPPGELSTEMVLQKRTGAIIESFPPTHNFSLFFEQVVAEIKVGNVRAFDNQLLSTSRGIAGIHASLTT
jgi:dTDP-3,4-didehydro-2,6-dideoxy-alpha-D-glucose 3-reductase